MIFIIKVTTNKEEKALEMIHDRVVNKNLEVYSIVRPHGLRGYIILEAADRDSAEEAAFNLPYVKGIIGKTVSYEEIKNILKPITRTCRNKYCKKKFKQKRDFQAVCTFDCGIAYTKQLREKKEKEKGIDRRRKLKAMKEKIKTLRDNKKEHQEWVNK